VRHRGPVGTRGRQRVVDIRDSHDLRCDRDLVAAQAVGIARAIIALVMPADDGLQVPGELDGGEQLEAPDRMHLHDLELLARQRAGLVQDLVRHPDLAKIVQVRAQPNRGQGRFIQRQFARYGKGALRHALAMAERVAIRRFDRLPPLAHHVEIGGLELRDFAADVDEVDARVEPAEQPVRLVQQCQRVLVAAHGLHQQRQFAHRLGFV